jgi:uncharacterized membrane protein
MSDAILITGLLAAATFLTRYLGVVLGQHLPTSGPWTRALDALPGGLIVSLVTLMLLDGGSDEWIGAAVALGVASATRNLPLTMVVGMAVVWTIRSYF